MQQAASNPIRLSLDTVRKLAVVKQGLHRRPPEVSKQSLQDAIRRMGVLQLDTISVVARSHYLVMLARCGLYDPADLDALLYPDRRLFEYWAHAACLIPVEDYRHFVPVIQARRESPLHPSRVRRLGGHGEELLETVLAEVRERGPLRSRDFEDPRLERGTWWDWKPAKTALEILFDRGHLMVDRRVSFQRYYDLAERVLPASAHPPQGAEEDWQRWAVQRSVSCLGVATARQVREYYYQKTPPVRAAVQALVAEAALLPVEVDGFAEMAYICPADLPLVREIQGGAHRATLTALLCPFDNLIWDRRRVKELFGFEYSSEMYVPAAKRVYGYYVLPILHKGRLVGRLDPKAERKTKTLIIRAVYLEPGQSPTEELVAAIGETLREFMAFHGSETLIIERSEPEDLGPRLLERVGG